MRRRPLRPRRPIRQQRINPRRPVPPKLREANRLFQNGDYKQAAKLFRELADKAVQRGIPQAPNLYLKSGSAYLKCEKEDLGEKYIFKALDLLLERKKWAYLRRATENISKRLKDEGFSDLSKKVDDWTMKNVPDNIKDSEIWTNPGISSRVTTKLPSNCQNCGANVNPKEVEWVESRYAVCGYCGSIINGDE